MKRLVAALVLGALSCGAMAQQSYTFLASSLSGQASFTVELSRQPDGTFAGVAHAPGIDIPLFHFGVGSSAGGPLGLFGFSELGADSGPYYDGNYSYFRALQNTYDLEDRGRNSGGSLQVLSVPEPETYALLAGGLMLIVGLSQRHRLTARELPAVRR